MWDSEDGQLRHTLRGHEKAIDCCCYSEDGTKILSGSGGSTLIMWCATTGTLVRAMQVEAWSLPIRSCCFSQSGRHLLVGSGNTIKLWCARSHQIQRTFEGHSGEVNCVAFQPSALKHLDSNVILSASDDKTLKLWNALNGHVIRTLVGHSGLVYRACFRTARELVGGSLLGVGGKHQDFKCWNL